jgi:hypothetical protein
MGVLFDYFLAESDEVAASALYGGPGNCGVVPAPSAAPQSQPRRWFRRKPQPASAQPASPQQGSVTGSDEELRRLPFVDGRRIDPIVMMGTAEALLTGRTYDEVDAARGPLRPLSMIESGELMVERLSDSLVIALASASNERLAEVAVPWSRTEEFWGHGDPEVLAGFLEELAELAQLAQASGRHMYCWTCV